MAEAKDRFSVIIPTLQRAEELWPLVDQCCRHPLVHEVLVINNAQVPLAWNSPKVRVLQQARNIYVNPAWNLGAREAVAEFLLISNDDVRFDDDLFPFLLGELRNREVGIIGPHPSCINGRSERLRTRFIGDCLKGFGTLMALRSNHYVDIPEAMLIQGGDDWLFWHQRHPNRALMGAKIATTMHTTAGSGAFNAVKQSDQEFWVSSWESIAGGQEWHRAAFRQNRRRNFVEDLRRFKRARLDPLLRRSAG